jgi:hypothetical protein
MPIKRNRLIGFFVQCSGGFNRQILVFKLEPTFPTVFFKKVI